HRRDALQRVRALRLRLRAGDPPGDHRDRGRRRGGQRRRAEMGAVSAGSGGAPARTLRAGREWRRFTPIETAGRLGAQLAVALLTVWMLTRLGIRWDYVADSPA